MRRKSERTVTKKSKDSPEKKVEKIKRTRTRRRKQSTSSENESGDESKTAQDKEIVADTPKDQPKTPVKENPTDETQEQVWQVKTAEGTSDTGEIQKLKICLTRPPNTPERIDRSPRSKRKHSRATSSSDTPSLEGSEEKKKNKHRSKRINRESKDEVETNLDYQEDEPEAESNDSKPAANLDSVISQSDQTQSSVLLSDQTPISTTCEERKGVDESTKTEVSQSVETQAEPEKSDKTSDADTTVASPQHNQPDDVSESNTETCSTTAIEQEETLKASEVNNEVTNSNIVKIPENNTTEDKLNQDMEQASLENKVSTMEDKTGNSLSEENNKGGVENNVVESSGNKDMESARQTSPELNKEKGDDRHDGDFVRSESMQSVPLVQEDTIANGQAAPIVINRKRRWGSRSSKITTQRTIMISTDVLKDIIPDVKPAEFDEVIEEKKPHKRVEMTERLERPVLPKIIIDNTENVELNRESEGKEKENIKLRDSHLSMTRKISIVKDSESIIRPPSPPRHKQSNILYISNLVRPFTLPQLKNLLQRTGKIVDDGFWIDKIKSKCFVKYETEDQAVETRHALHGVTWPVSNPKTLQVDFSDDEAFGKAKTSEEADVAPASTLPGTVEDWLREQDLKRERGELDKPWERKMIVREWDVGKNGKEKDKDKMNRKDERPLDKRRHRTIERSPEPAKKFKKKEEEAPAKLLDDLFRKTKTTPCIYWLPLSSETIAVKEEQRRRHMAEHERRLLELRRPPRPAHTPHAPHALHARH